MARARSEERGARIRNVSLPTHLNHVSILDECEFKPLIVLYLAYKTLFDGIEQKIKGGVSLSCGGSRDILPSMIAIAILIIGGGGGGAGAGGGGERGWKRLERSE